MNFIWADNRKEVNGERIFSIDLKKKVNRLEICAVDNYQIFLDGKFICYGPERTASGFSRKKIVNLENAKLLEIFVISHGVDTYICDRQVPFFGAEIYCDNKLVYDTKDFKCYIDLLRDPNTPRYSFQRGFVEKYSLDKENRHEVQVYSVDSPIILDGIGDTATYNEIGFNKYKTGIFSGFDTIANYWWKNDYRNQYPQNYFNIERDFLNIANGFNDDIYNLDKIKTGFIKLEIEAKTDSKIFVTFEEILNDNKWTFRRSQCNDLIVLDSKKGKYQFISVEPYCLKYLRIIYNGEVKITPSLILYENSKFKFDIKYNDEKIATIIEAAKNTFSQNAVDVFTDCPGRERAGWLCDSFFTSQAEFLFTGKNEIEHNFLENIILSQTPEIPKGMIPMSFPSEHYRFIPNWAMWFVLELYEYFLRTNDRELVDKAKDKVYGLIEYFKQIENELGLLDHLDGWIFVEWSIANTADYIKDINFPSNMLYSKMLEVVGKLYNDKEQLKKSQTLKENIIKYGFNGELFVDNAKFENGKIIKYEDHISETCQYYALYLNIYDDKKFVELIKNNFGPKRKDEFSNVGKSNIFIGYYLRLLWLLREKENKKVLEETIDYFYNMATKTGTLWEHNLPSASCNHGFASCVAVIIDKAIKG